MLAFVRSGLSIRLYTAKDSAMNAEAQHDPLASNDPTDVYIWDEPFQLPHDRVIWKARGEVRGNFPGYMHRDGGISDAEIRLTRNVLGIVSDRDSFGVPTSAVNRVSLEAGGEAHMTSVLSVDYVDALGQSRRFWLRIDKRRPLQSTFGRGSLAAGLREAGVGDLRLEQPVPGFSRMRQFPANGWDRHVKSVWTSSVVVSLASGDYVSDLTGWPDLLELRHEDVVLRLPYGDIFGMTTLSTPNGPGETVLFLTFKDGDVFISLKIRVPSQSEDDRASAGEVLTFLRMRGVRQYDAEDRLAFFDLVPDEIEELQPPSLFVTEPVESTMLPNGSAHHDVESGTRNGAIVRTGGSLPAEDRNGTTGFASGNQQYRALLMYVADSLRVYRALHADDLLTDEEWQSRRVLAVEEIGKVHQLIQLGLLHEVDLVTNDEFEAARRDLIDALSIRKANVHGA